MKKGWNFSQWGNPYTPYCSSSVEYLFWEPIGIPPVIFIKGVCLSIIYYIFLYLILKAGGSVGVINNIEIKIYMN